MLRHATGYALAKRNGTRLIQDFLGHASSPIRCATRGWRQGAGRPCGVDSCLALDGIIALSRLTIRRSVLHGHAQCRTPDGFASASAIIISSSASVESLKLGADPLRRFAVCFHPHRARSTEALPSHVQMLAIEDGRMAAQQSLTLGRRLYWCGTQGLVSASIWSAFGTVRPGRIEVGPSDVVPAPSGSMSDAIATLSCIADHRVVDHMTLRFLEVPAQRAWLSLDRDFTPVGTTRIGVYGRAEARVRQGSTKIIGLSVQ